MKKIFYSIIFYLVFLLPTFFVISIPFIPLMVLKDKYGHSYFYPDVLSVIQLILTPILTFWVTKKYLSSKYGKNIKPFYVIYACILILSFVFIIGFLKYYNSSFSHLLPETFPSQEICEKATGYDCYFDKREDWRAGKWEGWLPRYSTEK